MDRNWVVAAALMLAFMTVRGENIAHDRPQLQAFLKTHKVKAWEKFSSGDSCDKVYKLHTPNNVLVLKILNKRRPLEKRQAVVLATRWGGENGVGPILIDHDPAYEWMVMTYSPGNVLEGQDLRDKNLLHKVCHALRTIHRMPSVHLTNVTPYSLQARVLNRWRDVRGYLPAHMKEVWDKIKARFFRKNSNAGGICPCHGDVKNDNILFEGDRPIFIDFGEVAHGSLYDDLGSFAYYYDLTFDEEIMLLKTYFGRLPKEEEMVALAHHRQLATLNHIFLKMRAVLSQPGHDIGQIKKTLDFLQSFL